MDSDAKEAAAKQIVEVLHGLSEEDVTGALKLAILYLGRGYLLTDKAKTG